MAAWWKLIAQQQSAMNASVGPYKKRVAFQLGAQNGAGYTWGAKLANRKRFGSTGAWERQLMNFSGATPTFRTAYGTAGSYGRSILFQNQLGATVPAGNKSFQPPTRNMGVGP